MGSRGIALLYRHWGSVQAVGWQGEERHSSTLSRPRHWKGVNGQRHAPTALYPRERPGGWVSPRASLDMRKISPPPGFDPRTVQPVASCYTDYATRPTTIFRLNIKQLLAQHSYPRLYVYHCHPVGCFQMASLNHSCRDVTVDSSWNVMAQDDARKGKWRGNWHGTLPLLFLGCCTCFHPSSGAYKLY
jgi:hypothetical protein